MAPQYRSILEISIKLVKTVISFNCYAWYIIFFIYLLHLLKKSCSFFDTIPECIGQTDEQTDISAVTTSALA